MVIWAVMMRISSKPARLKRFHGALMSEGHSHAGSGGVAGKTCHDSPIPSVRKVSPTGAA